MKRNHRTDILAHMELTPLTEQILDHMGDEGVDIRQRLMALYRTWALKRPPAVPGHLDKTA
jgi:hypothetical protein